MSLQIQQLINAAKRLDIYTAVLLAFVAFGLVDCWCEVLAGMSFRQVLSQLVMPAVVGRF